MNLFCITGMANTWYDPFDKTQNFIAQSKYYSMKKILKIIQEFRESENAKYKQD